MQYSLIYGVKMNKERRQLLQLIGAGTLGAALSTGCSRLGLGEAEEPYTVQEALNHMTSTYDGDNQQFVISQDATSEEINGITDIVVGYQAATGQHITAPHALTDLAIMDNPYLHRNQNLIVIGDETNQVIAHLMQTQGQDELPDGVGVLRAYDWQNQGQKAIAVMGSQPLEIRKAARVLTDVLTGDTHSYNLKGNLIYVHGDLNNPRTEIRR